MKKSNLVSKSVEKFISIEIDMKKRKKIYIGVEEKKDYTEKDQKTYNGTINWLYCPYKLKI
jgi:hypothetical protein